MQERREGCGREMGRTDPTLMSLWMMGSWL